MRLRGRTPLVLVPVANPTRAVPLMQIADALAAPGVGRILALTVVPYDPEDFRASSLESWERTESALRKTVEAAGELGRPFEAVVRLVSDVTEAIVSTAAERKPEAIVLGMSRMEKGGPKILERVIARTNADVVVLNSPPDWSLDRVRRVIVPIAGETPHSALRARILGLLRKKGEPTGHLLRILRPGQDRERARRHLEMDADDLGLPEGHIIIEESVNPVEAIVRHSKQADLIVLGLGQRGGRTRLIGDFALAVVGGAHCPVIAIAHARRR